MASKNHEMSKSTLVVFAAEGSKKHSFVWQQKTLFKFKS